MKQFFSDHFSGLFRFSGREGLKPYWLWVAFNMAVQMLVSFAAMVPTMMSMSQKLAKFAAEHPDQVTRTYGPGSYSVRIEGNHPELMPDFGGLITGYGALVLLFVLLLAAATARRLHDTNRSGAWGLLPLPFLAASFWLMPAVFDDLAKGGDNADLSMFFVMMINNLLYLVALGVVIVLCVMRGTPGENRYGPPPAE